MNCDICRECETVKHCMNHGCIPVVKIEEFRPLTLKQRLINVINRWFKQ